MNPVPMLVIAGAGLLFFTFMSAIERLNRQTTNYRLPTLCFALSILCFALAAGLGIKP